MMMTTIPNRWRAASLRLAGLLLLGGLLCHGAGCSAPARAAGGPDAPRPTVVAQGPHAGEELWVVERQARPAVNAPPAAGGGTLSANVGDQAALVPIPLTRTDVTVSIAGCVATVDLTQRFHNARAETIEAVYAFPLPRDAAVSEFVMTVGDRKIRGVIRERAEAERIYAEARAQGYVASLLSEELGHRFTQRVANIEPGKAIDIRLRYAQTLAFADGGYEFAFPLAVSVSGAGAKPPEQRSGRDVSLAVRLDAGVPIEGIECTTHPVRITGADGPRADVRLADAETIPNRDFVLRYKVAGRALATATAIVNLPRQIKQLATEYGLLSPLSAFLAVDTSRRAAPREIHGPPTR